MRITRSAMAACCSSASIPAKRLVYSRKPSRSGQITRERCWDWRWWRPKALQAMAIRATVDLLDDKTDSPWIGRILAIDPKYGEAYETIGYFFVLNRRYEEGIQFYRKAIELKPDLWSARSQLGINLMRLGREGEARQQLETAFNNGWTDKPTTNTLNLMES